MQLPIMTFNIQHGVNYKRRLAEPDKYSDFELIDLPLMALMNERYVYVCDE